MSKSHRRKSSTALLACLAVGLSASLLATPTSASAEITPGARPNDAPVRAAALADSSTEGLQLVVNERGRISQSTSALGTTSPTGTLRVEKPAGATVRGAWLAYATFGFRGQQIVPGLEPVLADQPVPITNEIRNGINSYNYFADVSDIVKPLVDAAPAGAIDIPVSEPDSEMLEGEMLVVVFDDPAVSESQSVSILYGALATAGDSYKVRLTEPIDLSNPAIKLEMSLGITYSYQVGGGEQYSAVAVNGEQLTNAAGGEDDGESAGGALITVGGVGDSPENPPTPTHRLRTSGPTTSSTTSDRSSPPTTKTSKSPPPTRRTTTTSCSRRSP